MQTSWTEPKRREKPGGVIAAKAEPNGWVTFTTEDGEAAPVWEAVWKAQIVRRG